MIYFNGTFHEFVEHAVNKPSDAYDAIYSQRSSRRERDGGFFGASWDEAKQFVTVGDVKRAETIQSRVVDVANAVRMCMPRYDVQYVIEDGAYVDVARFLDGEPECFGKFVPSGNTLAKKLSIAVNMAFNCNVSSDEMKEYGAKIAGIMLGLRAVGVQLELYLYYAIGGNSNKKSQCIIDCTHCDVAYMASAFSSYFFRRMWFSWSETQNAEYIRTFGVGNGYGHSVDEPCEKKVDLNLYQSAKWLNKSQDELIAIVDKKLKEVK